MTRKPVAAMTLAEVVRAARARADVEARIYDQTEIPALLRRLADAVERGDRAFTAARLQAAMDMKRGTDTCGN